MKLGTTDTSLSIYILCIILRLDVLSMDCEGGALEKIVQIHILMKSLHQHPLLLFIFPLKLYFISSIFLISEVLKIICMFKTTVILEGKPGKEGKISSCSLWEEDTFLEIQDKGQWVSG